MFIERLAVKGFRSLADVMWEPGKLNVLIGPNGGGKTNLLKVVRLLKASALGQLGKFVQREGGMQPMVWDGSAGAIEIECKNKSTLFLGSYGLVLHLGYIGPTYFIQHERLLLVEQGKNLLERKESRAYALTDDERYQELPLKELNSDETLLSMMSGPLGPSAFLYDFSSSLSNSTLYGIINLETSREPKVVRTSSRRCTTHIAIATSSAT
jgi:predicted ATPase